MRDKERADMKRRHEERSRLRTLAMVQLRQGALNDDKAAKAPVPRRKRKAAGKSAPLMQSVLRGLKVMRRTLVTWPRDLPSQVPSARAPTPDENDDVAEQASSAASPTRRGDNSWDKDLPTEPASPAVNFDEAATVEDVDVDVKPIIPSQWEIVSRAGRKKKQSTVLHIRRRRIPEG